MASKEGFWNIELGGIVYLLGFIVIAVACYALYRRFRLWRLGSEDDRLNNLGEQNTGLRWARMADGLWHRRIVTRPLRGRDAPADLRRIRPPA